MSEDTRITTKPFTSQAQWSWAFATGQDWAKRWARETPGGKGKRFRRLPYKKRKAADEETVKAPNYSARAGETIAGNLARGGDGKFASAGTASAPADKPGGGAPKRTRRRRPLRRRRGETDEQLAAREAEREQQDTAADAEQADAKRQERQANREQVYSDLGLYEDATAALTALYEGGDNTDDGGLVNLGLAEQNRDGTYRLTPAGRQLVRAAERGDSAMARDTLAKARDDKAEREERTAAQEQKRTAAEAKRQAAQTKREAATAERAKRQQERAATRGARGRGGARSSQGGRKRDERKPATQDAPLATAQQRQRLSQAFARLSRVRQAAPRQQKALSVFKDASGRYRWLAVSSSAYRDRDGEIVTQKALERAVDLADTTGRRGPLRWWHLPGVDIGDCDFQATHGRFLVESGTFRSEAIGQRVAAKAEGLELSIGFVHPATEPDAAKCFHQIAIFERSLAPAGRVSNLFTRLLVKEHPTMQDEKLKAAGELLGADLLEKLLAKVDQTDKAAQGQGVAYKEASADAPPAELTINGVTYALKALPPELEVDEAKAEGDVDVMVEEEATGDDDLTLSPADIQAIGMAVAEALAPMFGEVKTGLDIDKKMAAFANEMKSALGGYAGQAAQKDAEAAEAEATRAAEIAALKQRQDETAQRLKELEGDQPRSAGYRPSQAADTVVLPTTDTTKAYERPAPDPEFAAFFGVAPAGA